MPPKKSIQKKRASTKKLSQETIPIFEILSNKQIRQPSLELMPQIQSSLKQNPISLKKSLLNMLVRICGLEQYASDIQSDNTLQVLEDILEKAYQTKKFQSTPLILDTRNNFRKDFIKRLRQFLQAVMSDQLQLLNDQKVQFNQSFLVWLQILTKSKHRQIRSSSIQFAKIFVEEEIKFYDYFHEKKQSKKAFNISKNIGYYLQKIFSQRLNDIDPVIREVAFEATELILSQLQGQIITQSLLNKTFTPLFEQDAIILQRTIKTLYNLLSECTNQKCLTEYLKDHLQKIVQFSKSTLFTGTNVQSLKIIEMLHHKNPALKLLNREYMVSVLQSFAPLNLHYGLHNAVQVFYQSLYSNSQQLQVNSSIVLIQLINLLLGITNQRNLPVILKTFFVSSRKVQSTNIFNIDNMFTLMMSQYYRDERDTDVKLKQKQLQLLLTIMSEWTKHSAWQFEHLIRDKPVYEKILDSYNNHLLINCKQLFFEKMPKCQNFSQKYLNLFAQIHTPTLAYNSLESYLSFVTQKIEKLFAQDLDNCQIYKQIVQILFCLSKDERLSPGHGVKSLVGKLHVQKMTVDSYELSQQQIFKLSAVFTRFPVSQLATSRNFLDNLVKAFAGSKKDKERIQILAVVHLVHHHNFMELFVNSSEGQQQVYKNARDKILGLYIQILDNGDEPISIRISAFRGLTYLLRMISNYKFEQSPSSKVNAYELSSQQMKTIYEFITGQLYQSDSLDYSSLDITRMLQSMSLENQQVKSQIIKLLFNLYEDSYVFACHSQSARFLVSLIKGEHQLHKEAFVRPHNLPIGTDLSREIQVRLRHFLETYLMHEISLSNVNKIIYWRLCYEIFNQTRQDEKSQIVMDKLFNNYFSKRKLDKDQKRRLTNKLMIFILHAVDKILERKEYINLDIYENIFRKINKKFEKQVLVRIKEFFIQKTQGIDSPFVKSFLQMLEKIARVQVKKPKKQDKQQQSSEGQQDRQNGQDQQNEQDKQDQQAQQKKQHRTKNSKRGNKGKGATYTTCRMMQVQQGNDVEDQVQMRRSARSQTKKKL